MAKMQSRPRLRNFGVSLVLLTGALPLVGHRPLFARSAKSSVSTSQTETEAADAFQKKLDYLQENAKHDVPDERPTVVPENEVNAYFAQRRLKLPDGVKSVRFQFQPGKVIALTRVDFEEITKEHHSWNPLLALFSGIHDAEVVAHAEGHNGLAQVDVDSVTLDGVSVPRIALEMFIERFVQKKFPSVRLDGQYKLPEKLNNVTIADRQSTVTQGRFATSQDTSRR